MKVLKSLRNKSKHRKKIVMVSEIRTRYHYSNIINVLPQ